jgi:hypothetical protein
MSALCSQVPVGTHREVGRGESHVQVTEDQSLAIGYQTCLIESSVHVESSLQHHRRSSAVPRLKSTSRQPRESFRSTEQRKKNLGYENEVDGIRRSYSHCHTTIHLVQLRS